MMHEFPAASVSCPHEPRAILVGPGRPVAVAAAAHDRRGTRRGISPVPCWRCFDACLTRALPCSCSNCPRCIPRSRSLARSFTSDIAGVAFTDQQLVFLISVLLGVVLFGVLTLRLHAVSRGLKPRFRAEIATALGRWPNAIIATIGALGFPLLLFGLGPTFTNVLPMEALIVVAMPLLWPAALFAVALPAFWCDGLGPIAAVAQAVRVSRRSSWRMVGAILATACIVLVFYVLTIHRHRHDVAAAGPRRPVPDRHGALRADAGNRVRSAFRSCSPC